MPTRNALVALFLFLVGVPVAAAGYLGTVGLQRERAMLIDRERAAMQRKADEVRDALVRQLQRLYRDPPAASGPVSDRFELTEGGALRMLEGAARDVPADIAEFARSDGARALANGVYGDRIRWEGDLAARRAGARVRGFRVDPERIVRLYLDPASPDFVLNRFDERVGKVELVRDDPRTRVRGAGPHGLPLVLYRHVVPEPGGDPVLLPPGYLLALSVEPAAALAGDLAAAGGRLAWALAIVAVVVALGMLFGWRALRAESRLASRKTEFINAVSHELRTPLTSIRMYADMLKEGWVKDEATARDYVGLLSAESERLARLVNNVLDFSRIEKGKKRFEMRVGDPAPVIREAAGILEPYLKEKGFVLGLAVPECLPACSFDKDALTQILVNLIDNAVKYGKNEVRVEADAVDGEVQLRVLDRGPGVPADDRDKIFDPFHRGGNAARGGGSGLGLALVHHYVEAHHGTIRVEDREGGGAVFALSFPAGAAAP